MISDADIIASFVSKTVSPKFSLAAKISRSYAVVKLIVVAGVVLARALFCTKWFVVFLVWKRVPWIDLTLWSKTVFKEPFSLKNVGVCPLSPHLLKGCLSRLRREFHTISTRRVYADSFIKDKKDGFAVWDLQYFTEQNPGSFYVRFQLYSYQVQNKIKTSHSSQHHKHHHSERPLIYAGIVWVL